MIHFKLYNRFSVRFGLYAELYLKSEEEIIAV